MLLISLTQRTIPCSKIMWESRSGGRVVNIQKLNCSPGIHFASKMHFAKPYACKQTTAFVGLANPIQSRALKRCSNTLPAPRKGWECKTNTYHSDILLRQSDIMQYIVILLVSLVVIFYLLKVNYLLA